MDGSMTNLNGRVNQLKTERDQLNAQVLAERQAVAEKELELTRAQSDFQMISHKLSEKEMWLEKYQALIVETESAITKMQIGSARLSQALEMESGNLQNKLRQILK